MFDFVMDSEFDLEKLLSDGARVQQLYHKINQERIALRKSNEELIAENDRLKTRIDNFTNIMQNLYTTTFSNSPSEDEEMPAPPTNDDHAREVYHKVDASIQTDVDNVAECSCVHEKRNRQKVTKVDTYSQTDLINGKLVRSQFVENTEKEPDTSEIYNPTVYVDPHCTTGDENTPPMLKMVLQSYNSFEKRYLCFFVDDNFGGPKSCAFVSIDDLLALPQYEDLKQQLCETHDTDMCDQNENDNLTLTVLKEIIARSYFPASPDKTRAK